MSEQHEQAVAETGVIRPMGPVSSVTVHAHMRSGPHSLLTDPLDMTIVIELMFLFGEQARHGGAEPLTVTPLSVLERLRAQGVRSGNGSRLVGRDAVYASFGRLRAKGYIRRIEGVDARGQRTGVSYEFYDWPAWNPDGADFNETAFPQVKSTSGNAGSGDAGSGCAKRAKQRSPQVKSTSGNAGSGDAGSGDAVRTFPQVKSTSGNAGSPPHPPEGGGGSSPLPPTGPDRTLPPQREEEVSYSEERLAEARRFLERLPRPWTVGRQAAGRLAPQLLAAADERGWRLDEELVAELTQNPGGMVNPVATLEKARIPNLVPYGMVHGGQSRRAGSPPAQRTEGGGLSPAAQALKERIAGRVTGL